MAHVSQYNPYFTDEDSATLVHLAPLATKPIYNPCGWVVGSNYEVCNELLQGHEFSDHLRTCHGVIGSDKTPLRCLWFGCSAEMKKESLMRHVHEKHLELRYACPQCAEQFTRGYTRDQHVTRKHSGSN